MKTRNPVVKAKKQKQQQLAQSRSIQQQSFLNFLCHLRRSPRIVQQIFSPYVKELASTYQSSSSVGSSISMVRVDVITRLRLEKEHIRLFQNFAKLVNHKQMIVKMVSVRSQALRPNLNNHLKAAYKISPKINLVRPQYYITELLADKFGQAKVGSRTKDLSDNQSILYNEPRFYQKLNEMVHYKNNSKLQNCILLLQYRGNSIRGGRSYSVINANSVQIWQMSSHIFPFPFAEQLNIAQPEVDQQNMNIRQDSIQQPTFGFKYKFIADQDKVTCASFSSDQFYLLTAGLDRKIKLWCLRLHILLAEYACHTRVVWDVQFNPSGCYFLSGAADGLIVLWGTEFQTPLRILEHGSDVYKVKFAKNPTYAISAGQNGCVKIWNLLQAKIKHCIEFANPITNFDIGHSGIYLLMIESDGRITIYNLLAGLVVTSFYFYSKAVNHKKQTKRIIHDACFSEDQREVTCISSNHIAIYSMEVLQSKQQSNIFDKYKDEENERLVAPKEIIMVSDKQKLNWCRYVDFGLLVVGASSI